MKIHWASAFRADGGVGSTVVVDSVVGIGGMVVVASVVGIKDPFALSSIRSVVGEVVMVFGVVVEL